MAIKKLILFLLLVTSATAQEPPGSTLTPNQAAALTNVQTPGGLIIDRTTSRQVGNATQAATIVTGADVVTQRNQNK